MLAISAAAASSYIEAGSCGVSNEYKLLAVLLGYELQLLNNQTAKTQANDAR
jgi:hypothetical protein